MILFDLSKKFVTANIKLMSDFKILTFQTCLSIKSLVRKGLKMKERIKIIITMKQD